MNYFIFSIAALSASHFARRPVKLSIDAGTNDEWRKEMETLLTLCPYSPSWICAFDVCGCLQTGYMWWVRNLQRLLFSQVRYKRELLVLSDNGTIALDWAILEEEEEKEEEAEKESEAKTDEKKTIIVVQHGMLGDSSSEYLLHLVEMLCRHRKDHVRVVVCVSRGCGGLSLTTRKSFCWFDTQDYREAIEHIRSNNPSSLIIGLGYSLGAALMCKYLGEMGESSKLNAAICISPPWNVKKKPPLFSLFSVLLVLPLKAFVLKHYAMLKRDDIPLTRILCTLNLAQWDAVFVKAYGLDTLEDYYRDASAIHTSHQISTPTLAISAMDDPICCHSGAPSSIDQNVGKGLCVVKTEFGGHLAFPLHSPETSLLSACWIDNVVMKFVDAQLSKERS